MEWLLEVYARIKSELTGDGADPLFLKIVKSSIPVLMGVLVFFNPFPHTTSIKEICFYLSAALALVLMISKRGVFTFRSPLLLPLLLFAAWSLLSAVFALDIRNSIHDFYSHLIRHMVFYFILINVFLSKRRLAALSWIMVLSAAVLSVGSIGYFYILLGNSLSERLINFDQLPCNRSSLVAALAIVFSLYLAFTKIRWTRKGILVLCLIPLLALMLLTQTRGTLIALSFSLLLLFFRHGKLILVFVCGMLIVFATTPIKNRLFDMETSYPRLSTHYRSIEILKDYPVIGIGFGMKIYGTSPLLTPERYMPRIPEAYRHYEFFDVPHNMLMSIAVRTGLIGLGLFLYLLIAFVYMCWRLIIKGKDGFIREWGLCILSAFVLFLVVGLFEPVFNHSAETILFALFGMGTILWRMNQDGQAEMPGNS
jgi:O-antigen ligase